MCTVDVPSINVYAETYGMGRSLQNLPIKFISALNKIIHLYPFPYPAPIPPGPHDWSASAASQFLAMRSSRSSHVNIHQQGALFKIISALNEMEVL